MNISGEGEEETKSAALLPSVEEDQWMDCEGSTKDGYLTGSQHAHAE